MPAAKLKKLRCGECCKWFPPKRAWQKFCDRKCRNDNANRVRKEALESVREDREKLHPSNRPLFDQIQALKKLSKVKA